MFPSLAAEAMAKEAAMTRRVLPMVTDDELQKIEPFYSYLLSRKHFFSIEVACQEQTFLSTKMTFGFLW